MYKNLISLVISSLLLVNLALAEVNLITAKATLISEYTGIDGRKNVSLGVILEPEPGWHVYWKYAGDYGSAPKFDTRFNGQKINPKIDWPTPEVIRGENYVNYGYSKKVVYLVEFSSNKIKKINDIKIDFEWLACKIECIPGFKTLKLSLPWVETLTASKYKNLIEETRFSLPIPLSNYQIQYQLNDEKKLELYLPDLPDNTTSLILIPEIPKIIKNKAKQDFNPSNKTLTVELRKKTDKTPYLKGLLLKDPPFETNRTALEVEIGEKEIFEFTTLAKEKKQNIFYIILAALLGGIILNFMPCVFPVIALKLLSLSQKSGKSLSYRLKHSFSFGLGIITTFWSLVILIKIAKSFGHQIGWGFQLQEPSFVLFLIFLLTLVALNLLGLFEIKLVVKGSTQSNKSTSVTSSFLSGVLTTVLATPCTAPFMASAVAYGLGANMFITFLIFSSLGIGLALPYTLLACLPQFQKFIPKPGNWMNVLKTFLAFPLFATILWLLWVLEKQSTTNYIFLTLTFLLALSLTTWVYGILSAPSKKKTTRLIASILFIALLVGGYLFNAKLIENKVKEVSKKDLNGDYINDKYNQKWYVYNDSLLKSLENNNKSYYLDVTAAWCLTCQLNKANVFSSKKVRDIFEKKNILLVKADWTNYDKNITELLQRNGKAGVPFNVLYDSKTQEKTTLPELLSESIILNLIN